MLQARLQMSCPTNGPEVKILSVYADMKQILLIIAEELICLLFLTEISHLLLGQA